MIWASQVLLVRPKESIQLRSLSCSMAYIRTKIKIFNKSRGIKLMRRYLLHKQRRSTRTVKLRTSWRCEVSQRRPNLWWNKLTMLAAWTCLSMKKLKKLSRSSAKNRCRCGVYFKLNRWVMMLRRLKLLRTLPWRITDQLSVESVRSLRDEP